MPYVKGGGASSRYGFMGLGTTPPGPAHNYRTAEQTHAEAIERKNQLVKIPISQYEETASTLRKANSMAEVAIEDEEVRAKHGEHCDYIRNQIALIQQQLSANKEYGPGCVMLPSETWQVMMALAQWVRPIMESVNEIMQPVVLVVRNGQTVDEARRLGSYEEV